MNLYAFCENNPACLIDALGMRVYVRKHMPSLEPPGGWTTPGSRAETVYRPQRYEVKESIDKNGKLSFRVEIIPDDLCVDVYFKTGLASMWAMNYEKDHISVATRWDRALHEFKAEVERIFDCPDAARRQKRCLEEALTRTINELLRENFAYDAPGGPHDLQNNSSLDL